MDDPDMVPVLRRKTPAERLQNSFAIWDSACSMLQAHLSHLEHVVSVFERLGISYLITGSVAAMAYGEPRLTNDIDIVAGITERHIPGLLEAFPADDYYLYDEAVRDAWEAIEKRLRT